MPRPLYPFRVGPVCAAAFGFIKEVYFNTRFSSREFLVQVVTVTMEKAPNAIYPLALQTTIPPGTQRGDEFLIDVAQQNTEGTVAGGAAMVYITR